jgi:hypothetical protein
MSGTEISISQWGNMISSKQYQTLLGNDGIHRGIDLHDDAYEALPAFLMIVLLSRDQRDSSQWGKSHTLKLRLCGGWNVSQARRRALLALLYGPQIQI